MNRIKTGTVEGTGAAIAITCGFVPAVVKLLNIDGNAQMIWTKNMPDAAGQKIVDSATGTTDVSYVTSAGITPVGDAATDTYQGFTIGADTDINVATTGAVETILWIAYPDHQ